MMVAGLNLRTSTNKCYIQIFGKAECFDAQYLFLKVVMTSTYDELCDLNHMNCV